MLKRDSLLRYLIHPPHVLDVSSVESCENEPTLRLPVHVQFEWCLVVVVVNSRTILCCLSCRVVGGFEALTAMENVESDAKTDKPKVRRCNRLPASVTANTRISMSRP